jgi:TonB-dependent receptor
MKISAPSPACLRLSKLSLGVLALLSSQAQAAPVDMVDAASTVVVTGQRASMRNAIAAQEKADNIVSVVSSDDIGGLPDKNAAEALARLPGVSVQRDQGEGRYVTVRGLGPDLNSTTINGALVPSPEAGRRGVALDVLPAGLIRSLEVTKTLTPDMDANSLGGTVEVKSLSAFDLPGKLLSANLGASYDQNTSQTSPNGGVLWADRFMDGTLGVAAGLSLEKRKFGSDNVETGGAWEGNKLSGFELRDYLPNRERKAFALNVDYHPLSGAKYYLRSFLSQFSDDEVRDRMTVGTFGTASETVAAGETTSARVERRLRQRKYTQDIRSIVLGTEQQLAGWKLNLVAGSSRSTDETPDALKDGRFRASVKGVGFTNTEMPQLIAPATVFDPANYKLQGITLQQAAAKDSEHHAQIDLTRDLDLAGLRSTLKFGAKTSRRDKVNDTNEWTFGSSYFSTAARAMAGYVTADTLDYKLGNIGYALNPAALRAAVAKLDRSGARLALESTVDDYKMNEDIDAAYLQNKFRFDDWSLLAGVRAEHTSFKANGQQIDEDALLAPVQRQRSYTNWLPSLQARYDLDRATSLRAAWSNAVVRANFSQLAPGISLESSTEAVIGNPDLKPLRAHNLDLGVERILGSDGTVSAYLFYKDIKDFTYTTNLAGTGMWKDYSSAVSYANGQTASVKGLELSYQQPLRMLPAPFNRLLVGVNGSYTKSDADIARYDLDKATTLHRSVRFPGQSDRVLNLMVGYEHGPLTARIAANYKSPYLLELGDDILRPEQDRIVDAQTQVDLSLSYQLTRQVQLVFEANNVNNEKYYVYQGAKQYNTQYEQYGRTYKIGLKVSMF